MVLNVIYRYECIDMTVIGMTVPSQPHGFTCHISHRYDVTYRYDSPSQPHGLIHVISHRYE